MDKLLFTKYSNQRNPAFAIRTDIVRTGDGGRVIRKYPDTDAALTHIRHMQATEENLKQQFRSCLFEANRAQLREGCIEFEYVEGQTLEQQLDACLLAKDIEPFSDLVRRYAAEVRHAYAADQAEITADLTEEFRAVFGPAQLRTQTAVARNLDVDLIFSNILETGDRWTVIDYEWTFAFPVPIEFALWRAGKVYLESYGSREAVTPDQMNRLLGVTEENVEAYREMETYFLREYVQAGQSDLYNLYETIGQKALKSNPETILQNDTTGADTIQLYYDCGSGFSEEHSERRKVYADQYGFCSLWIRLPEQIKRLRIDPGDHACILVVDKLCGYADSGVDVLKYAVNGKQIGESEYLINHEDPQITTSRIRETTKTAEIRFMVNADPIYVREKLETVKKRRKLFG